ncbi:hypothetical protein V6N11_008007 [Hibiscus sabdariffa]|uniref:Uncharacterized protein n=1 Tax=Hibiscus sabdariffa TaxID=183260 RepID=A0ABR2PZC0_9ROSI
MVLNDGNWNWDLIHALLEPSAVASLLNLVPPSYTLSHDRCYWIDGSRQTFSIKNAYSFLAYHSWNATNPAWKFIWKENVPCLPFHQAS